MVPQTISAVVKDGKVTDRELLIVGAVIALAYLSNK
jgi:hypothetical protein